MTNKADYSKIKLNRGKVNQEFSFTPISGLLERVAKKLKINDNYEDFEIIKYWSEFLISRRSESLAKYTFAHRITRDRKLVIGVRSAVIANELQFIKDELESSFASAVSQKFTREVKALVFELRA